jgi:hypothetical protein
MEINTAHCALVEPPLKAENDQIQTQIKTDFPIPLCYSLDRLKVD